MRLAIPLALDDAASEDDVFEIEDREIFIFQFFGGVEGYDIVQRANQVAYSGDRESWHTGNSTGARLRCITIAFSGGRLLPVRWDAWLDLVL